MIPLVRARGPRTPQSVADTRRRELLGHLNNQDNPAIETFLAHGPDVMTPSPLLAWQLALHQQPRIPLEEHIWKKKMGELGKDLDVQNKRASDLEREVLELGSKKYASTAKTLEDRARLNVEAAKAQEKHVQELKALENERNVAERKGEQIKAELERKVAAEKEARQKAEKEKQDFEAKAAENQRSHQEQLEKQLETISKTLAAEKEARQKAEQDKQDFERKAAELQTKHTEAVRQRTQAEATWQEGEAKLEEERKQVAAEKDARQKAEQEKQDFERKAAELQTKHTEAVRQRTQAEATWQEGEAKLEEERKQVAAEKDARQKAEKEKQDFERKAEEDRARLTQEAAEAQEKHEQELKALENEREAKAELERQVAAEKEARQKAEQEKRDVEAKVVEHKEAEAKLELEMKQLQDREQMLLTENALLGRNNRQLKWTNNLRQFKATASDNYRRQLRRERDELKRKLEANRATLETLAKAKRELENKVLENVASLTRVRQEADDCHEQEAALKSHQELQDQDHKNWILTGKDITEHTQNDPRAQKALLDLYWRSSVDNPNELVAAFNQWKDEHEHTPVTPLTPTMNAESPHPHPAQHMEEKRESSRRLVDDRAASHAETAEIARRVRMNNEANDRMHDLQELSFTPRFTSDEQRTSYNDTTSKIRTLRISQAEKDRLIRKLNYATHYNLYDLESRVWAHITQHEFQESERRRQKPNIFREHFYSSSLSSTPELAEVASASLIGRRASTVSDSKRRGDWQGNFSGGDDYLRRLAVQYSKFV